MKELFFLLLCTPAIVAAQGEGIKFEKNLSWQEVKNKAKTENKYIFVDCYATWCGPCKQMDEYGYVDDSVGAFMNSKFISIKIQMDTSQLDKGATKALYASAHHFQSESKISAYPTYLFFSPDGEILHKGMGVQQAKNFILLAISALDISQQYYTLLNSYQSAKKDFSSMPYLATKAKSFYDKNLSDIIASNHIHDYLEKLPEKDLCKKEYFDFVGSFIEILNLSDKIFGLCLHRSSLIDSMEYEGYSSRVVYGVINNKEIIPLITVAKHEDLDPKW